MLMYAECLSKETSSIFKILEKYYKLSFTETSACMLKMTSVPKILASLDKDSFVGFSVYNVLSTQ